MFPSRLVSALGKVDLANNHSMDFDGTDDYVDIGKAYNGVKSISFLLKVDDVTSNTDYVLGLNDTDYVSIVDGTVTLNGFSGGTNTIYVDSSQATTVDTEWHHIFITSTTARNASNCDLGRTQSNNSYNMVGNLDEVAFTSDIKTPADFFSDSVPLDLSGLSNLKNWWRMGDGDYDDFTLISDQANATLTEKVNNGDASAGSPSPLTMDDGDGTKISFTEYNGTEVARHTSTVAGEATSWKVTREFTDGIATRIVPNADGNYDDKVFKVSLSVYIPSGQGITTLSLRDNGTAIDSTTTVGSWVTLSGYIGHVSGTGYFIDVWSNSTSTSGGYYLTTDWSIKLASDSGSPGLMQNMASGDIVSDTI